MNERIRELAEQAGFNFRVDCVCDDEMVRIYKTADKVEKLAELLVKECAGVAWGIYANQEIASGIKQHFGVE